MSLGSKLDSSTDHFYLLLIKLKEDLNTQRTESVGETVESINHKNVETENSSECRIKNIQKNGLEKKSLFPPATISTEAVKFIDHKI